MPKKYNIRNRTSIKKGGKKKKMRKSQTAKKSRPKQIIVKNEYKYQQPTFKEAVVEGAGFGIGWEVGERAVEKAFDNDEE